MSARAWRKRVPSGFVHLIAVVISNMEKNPKKTVCSILRKYNGVHLKVSPSTYQREGYFRVYENYILINPADEKHATEVVDLYNELRTSPLCKALL